MGNRRWKIGGSPVCAGHLMPLIWRQDKMSDPRPKSGKLPDPRWATGVSPLRPQHYVFEVTAATQAWLSRYHCTVSRMPRSKVYAGSQPSSRLILEASMA